MLRAFVVGRGVPGYIESDPIEGTARIIQAVICLDILPLH